jgi:DNA-binding NarL/FixJ family response regulator
MEGRGSGNEGNMRIKVLLVDDHKILRKCLRSFLEQQSDIEVVAEAENGREAIERCKEFGVDLVLMDLNMPDVDGIEATRRIVAEFPQIHVIVLTSHSEKRYVAETLKSGAKGYLVKENASDELVDAIHEVFLGNMYLSKSLTN